jgi:hypothetical protein
MIHIADEEDRGYGEQDQQQQPAPAKKSPEGKWEDQNCHA